MNVSMWIVAMLCTILPATVHAQESIEVVASDGRRTHVSLATLERRTVVTQDRGLRTTFDGVALRDVLGASGVPFSEALKGRALAQVVLATASDGYQVAYAIAELDAAFTDQLILLADHRNGKPLLPDTGPLQIVVPNDNRPARWIRQVTRLEVRQLH